MQIRRPSELGAIIMTVRRHRGLSQEQLAERLGVSRVWLGQVERGKASPRLDLVLRVLNELQINLAAHTSDETPERQQNTAPAAKALIDIDDIADTGLMAKGPRPSSAKRPRR